MSQTIFELWLMEIELWVMETANPNNPLLTYKFFYFLFFYFTYNEYWIVFM